MNFKLMLLIYDSMDLDIDFI